MPQNLSKSVLSRAIEYGAAHGSDPIETSPGLWGFEVDTERVALYRLTYDANEDTFQGWDMGSVPVWEQK